MKNLIIIVPFIFAFIFVTGAIVYLNSTYQNIFQFDFTPKSDKKLLTAADSLAIKDTLDNKGTKPDTSLISTDNQNTDIANQNLSSDKIDLAVQENRNIEQNTNQKSMTDDIEKSKRDSAYAVWLKKTVKLVENLPPAQASKLLKNYSDNQARDIIYAMKQKQAAKIISYLEPEYVHKLTRFQ